jgi:hypothetical protein
LLGKAVTIARERGRPIDLPGGGLGLDHDPSQLSCCASRTQREADEEFAAFVEDLKAAKASLG